MYHLLKTPEFEEWFRDQPPKTRLQIDVRLLHITSEGHFGNHKKLTIHVWELKWKNGRRLYYAFLEKYKILLLVGGNKNGQNKDIKKAEKTFSKYAEISS